MATDEAFINSATEAINGFADRCRTLRQSESSSDAFAAILDWLPLISAQLNQMASIQLELLKDATGPSGLGTMPPEG